MCSSRESNYWIYSGQILGFSAIKGPRVDTICRQLNMGITDTQLADAIEKHNSVETRRLVGLLTNVDYHTKKRCTALYTAVEWNNIEAAVLLLERGASMNIMPKKRIYQNVSECPIMLALKMGESHEEMQMLFLDHLDSVKHTWLSAKDKEILEAIPHSAMLYSTPCVFIRAAAESSGKDLFNKHGLNALMSTLKQVGLFSSDAVKCAKTMENVMEIVIKYPAMAWESLQKDEECGLMMHTTGSTALGMLVYQTIPVRKTKNRQFQVISEGLLELRHILEGAGSPSDALLDYSEKIQSDVEKNSNVVLHLVDEFIPALWTVMLRPMRIALAMGTHKRLGEGSGCFAHYLNTDTIDIIFANLISDVTSAPHLIEHMLR